MVNSPSSFTNDGLPVGGKGGQSLARQAKPISNFINGNCLRLAQVIPHDLPLKIGRSTRCDGKVGVGL